MPVVQQEVSCAPGLIAIASATFGSIVIMDICRRNNLNAFASYTAVAAIAASIALIRIIYVNSKFNMPSVLPVNAPGVVITPLPRIERLGKSILTTTLILIVAFVSASLVQVAMIVSDNDN